MLNFIDALSQYFTTSVGSYWCYMWIGVGVAICFLVIFDHLRR